MANLTPVLNQDEIDQIFSHRSPGQIGTQQPINPFVGQMNKGGMGQMNPQMGQQMNNVQFVPEQPKAEQGRIIYTTGPIYHYGSKIPDYWGVRKTYEKWDPNTQTWKYMYHTEKLYYPNGHPVGGV